MEYWTGLAGRFLLPSPSLATLAITFTPSVQALMEWESGPQLQVRARVRVKVRVRVRVRRILSIFQGSNPLELGLW